VAEPAEVVLSAESLTKRFGRREAVADVSFEVRAGEVFGFLGPNGAGKTTTIRMLVGLARPDRGRVRIRGFDVARQFTRAMAHVGAIVEAPDLYRYLTGRENLLHFARMLPAGAASRIEDLARMVALAERLDEKVSTYSLGMRQRLGIAQALLGNPGVLILDEPANGLDPAGIVAMRETLRHLAAEGKTVFVSSHLLAEVQQLADVIGIIAAGRLVREGSIGDLLHGEDLVRVKVADHQVETAVGVLGQLAGEAGVEASPAAVGWITVRIAAARAADVNRALAEAGIYAARLEAGSHLEDLFLSLTADESTSHEGTFQGISSARTPPEDGA